MKKYDTIQEGKWDEFLQDWIERRDHNKYPDTVNFGTYIGRRERRDEHYIMTSHVVHVRAADTGDNLHELHILTASRISREPAGCHDGKRKGMWPIVCLVDCDGFEDIEEFDRFGNSKSGKYRLYYESVYFDPGDYVATTMGAVGIYANSWYLFCGIDGEGNEHLDQFGYGITCRMATEEEAEAVDRMLAGNNKKWNNDKKELEGI